MRYGRLTCAQKLLRDGRLNLAHGIETKKRTKIKQQKQKTSISEETVQAIVREGSVDRFHPSPDYQYEDGSWIDIEDPPLVHPGHILIR